MNKYKRIGVKYISESKGTGGKIKQKPKDFVVQEISKDGEITSLEPSDEIPNGWKKYTHFTLVKRDWNQSQIIKKISGRCEVSRKRFSYSGTKDKKALTSQRISAWKVKPETLTDVKIKDCELGDYSYKNNELNLGDHWGNRFSVWIRDVKRPENAEEAVQKIRELGGIPNFFGPQRFGMRLNNHLVGKKIFKENLEGAAKEFLTGTIKSEKEEGRKARQKLAKNWGDFKQALKDYPRYMRFERAVLDRLNRYENDYVGAFKQLPKFLYKIFTHAYQSYIFNRILSEKIESGQSLEGEGNLPGYDSNLTKREKELLEEDGISQEDLKVDSFPEASVKGGKRPYLAEVRTIEHEKEAGSLLLKFDLEKGSYATVLLREITK